MEIGVGMAINFIYDLEEKASNYKDQNEILLARALRAEADLASAKIELDRKPTNTAPVEGSNKEEKEEGNGKGNGNIGSSDKNKMDEEIAALWAGKNNDRGSGGYKGGKGGGNPKISVVLILQGQEKSVSCRRK